MKPKIKIFKELALIQSAENLFFEKAIENIRIKPKIRATNCLVKIEKKKSGFFKSERAAEIKIRKPEKTKKSVV
jgi:hypothetical protein